VEREVSPQAQHPHLQLIHKRQLAELLGVNPWTLDRWRKLGHIPLPLKLTDGTLAWRISAIEKWLQEREEAADGAR
jgi:predicted DNA-binding transcriptional regulator AlpA